MVGWRRFARIGVDTRNIELGSVYRDGWVAIVVVARRCCAGIHARVRQDFIDFGVSSSSRPFIRVTVIEPPRRVPWFQVLHICLRRGFSRNCTSPQHQVCSSGQSVVWDRAPAGGAPTPSSAIGSSTPRQPLKPLLSPWDPRLPQHGPVRNFNYACFFSPREQHRPAHAQGRYWAGICKLKLDRTAQEIVASRQNSFLSLDPGLEVRVDFCELHVTWVPLRPC